jgi:hypothetical protein
MTHVGDDQACHPGERAEEVHHGQHRTGRLRFRTRCGREAVHDEQPDVQSGNRGANTASIVHEGAAHEVVIDPGRRGNAQPATQPV